MQMYSIPPDTRDKEKIIGGLFTLTQFLFLIIGFGAGALIAFLLNTFATGGDGSMNAVAILFGMTIGMGIFAPFAFIKIRSMGDMELFKYLICKLKFEKRNKEYPNININQGGDR